MVTFNNIYRQRKEGKPAPKPVQACFTCPSCSRSNPSVPFSSAMDTLKIGGARPSRGSLVDWESPCRLKYSISPDCAPCLRAVDCQRRSHRGEEAGRVAAFMVYLKTEACLHEPMHKRKPWRRSWLYTVCPICTCCWFSHEAHLRSLRRRQLRTPVAKSVGDHRLSKERESR